MPRKKKAPKTEKPLKSYVGILDTLGLDSFVELSNVELMYLQLRAQSNPQRHATLFIAEFDADMEPEKHIRKIKDPWDMWNYIQLTCTQLKSKPEDAKVIKNMRKLADTMVECTGKAY